MRCILFYCSIYVCANFRLINSIEDIGEKDDIPGELFLPIVETSYGFMQGQTVVGEGGRYSHEYLGIPYATPPKGKLRFKKPEPFNRVWQGVFDARKFGASCMQPRLPRTGVRSVDMWNPENQFREDCLTLNIWTPYPRRNKTSVMVWIHGDSFIKGGSSLDIHNGKTLSSHGDVIVVTFNYRLGAFGFLASGDDRIEGNMGFYDQKLALSWVKSNIEVFGGDPKSITIFGESSGAASVGLHVLTAQDEECFQRAILQSGSPLAYWASMTKQDAEKRLQSILNQVNCPNNENILQCLNTIPAHIIVNAQQDSKLVQFGHFTWVPVIDNQILLDFPRNMIENSAKNNKIEIMLGSSKNEGSRWMFYLLHFLDYKQPFTIKKDELHSLIDTVFYDLTETSRDQIKDFYLKLENLKSSPSYNRDLYQMILEDRHMYCPMLDFAKVFSKEHDVYMYRFKHRSNNEDWPKWMGVTHGSDLQYVFGVPLEKPDIFTKEERDLSLRMVNFWSNFAKYGNPTSGQKHILPRWPRFRNTTEKFVKFKIKKHLDIGRNFRDDHCKLWETIESDTLLQTNHKKSFIPHINIGKDFDDSFYYNVF